MPTERQTDILLESELEFKHFNQINMSRKTGIELIAEERRRQIEVEGWTKEHDATYINQELALAAVCYAIPSIKDHRSNYWPWDRAWWKPSPDDRIKELAKSGALIAAEIDRLQNKQPH